MYSNNYTIARYCINEQPALNYTELKRRSRYLPNVSSNEWPTNGVVKDNIRPPSYICNVSWYIRESAFDYTFHWAHITRACTRTQEKYTNRICNAKPLSVTPSMQLRPQIQNANGIYPNDGRRRVSRRKICRVDRGDLSHGASCHNGSLKKNIY